MRLGLLLAALLLVSSPPSTLAAGTDDAAVKFVLDSYKKALERRDLTGIERLFAEENEVIGQARSKAPMPTTATITLGRNWGISSRSSSPITW
ncbi:hypothetical protein CSC76_15275 [Pseudoxanthomonas mexicana]|nr:hypothetical protein CSC76_15275 [Pseudoxanthomonas mexicana]